MREALDVQFDLLRAGSDGLHRLAKAPWAGIQRRAGFRETGQRLGSLVLGVRDNDSGRERGRLRVLQLRGQSAQIVARCRALAVASV